MTNRKGDDMGKRVVRVDRDQIQSARWLIRLHDGDESKVDPLIVKIAHAQKMSPEQIAELEAT